MYVDIYMCKMCVHVCVYMHARMQACKCVFMLYICMYAWMDLCTYAHINVCVYVSMYLCVFAGIYVYMHTYIDVCMYVCMCAYMWS